MIFHTSGSAGTPKSFYLSPALLQAKVNSRGPAKGPEFVALKSMFCDLSPTVNTAAHIYQMWAQQHNVKFFYQTGGSIESAWKLFEKEQIEGIIGLPNGLTNYAMAHELSTHRFKLALCTGGAPAMRHIQIIRNGLSNLVLSSYGASEVGSIAIATAEQVLATRGCVGKLCPGVQVEIDTTAPTPAPAPTPMSSIFSTVSIHVPLRTVNPAATKLAPQPGWVRVKTQTMIQGYEDPVLTAKYFKDGWFYTGDVGYFNPEGLLIITGRAQL
jgi:acyl-CoA synthetase (AMP-forming)/AMP-acid ligase II